MTHSSTSPDPFDARSTHCSVSALLLGFDPDDVDIVSPLCPAILRYTRTIFSLSLIRQGRSDALLLEQPLAAPSALLSGHDFAQSWSAGDLDSSG